MLVGERVHGQVIFKKLILIDTKKCNVMQVDIFSEMLWVACLFHQLRGFVKVYPMTFLWQQQQ